MYLTGYFERQSHLTTSRFMPRLLRAVPLAALTLAMLYQTVPSVALSWPVAAAGLGLMTTFMIAWHMLAPVMVRQDALAERVMLIGDGDLARQIAASIDNARPWGFHLVGYVPVADERPRPARVANGGGRVLPFPAPETLDAPALGRLADVEAIMAEQDVHTVVVALSDRRGKLPLGHADQRQATRRPGFRCRGLLRAADGPHARRQDAAEHDHLRRRFRAGALDADAEASARHRRRRHAAGCRGARHAGHCGRHRRHVTGAGALPASSASGVPGYRSRW